MKKERTTLPGMDVSPGYCFPAMWEALGILNPVYSVGSPHQHPRRNLSTVVPSPFIPATAPGPPRVPTTTGTPGARSCGF